MDESCGFLIFEFPTMTLALSLAPAVFAKRTVWSADSSIYPLAIFKSSTPSLCGWKLGAWINGEMCLIAIDRTVKVSLWYAFHISHRAVMGQTGNLRDAVAVSTGHPRIMVWAKLEHRMTSDPISNVVAAGLSSGIIMIPYCGSGSKYQVPAW